LKQKVGKEPEGESKKRKELGNESPLASISASLPDPAVVEKEEQILEKEQYEPDVLEPLGECKCDTGM
jgi:hypothetical protein